MRQQFSKALNAAERAKDEAMGKVRAAATAAHARAAEALPPAVAAHEQRMRALLEKPERGLKAALDYLAVARGQLLSKPLVARAWKQTTAALDKIRSPYAPPARELEASLEALQAAREELHQARQVEAELELKQQAATGGLAVSDASPASAGAAVTTAATEKPAALPATSSQGASNDSAATTARMAATAPAAAGPAAERAAELSELTAFVTSNEEDCERVYEQCLEKMTDIAAALNQPVTPTEQTAPGWHPETPSAKDKVHDSKTNKTASEDQGLPPAYEAASAEADPAVLAQMAETQRLADEAIQAAARARLLQQAEHAVKTEVPMYDYYHGFVFAFSRAYASAKIVTTGQVETRSTLANVTSSGAAMVPLIGGVLSVVAGKIAGMIYERRLESRANAVTRLAASESDLDGLIKELVLLRIVAAREQLQTHHKSATLHQAARSLWARALSMVVGAARAVGNDLSGDVADADIDADDAPNELLGSMHATAILTGFVANGDLGATRARLPAEKLAQLRAYYDTVVRTKLIEAEANAQAQAQSPEGVAAVTPSRGWEALLTAEVPLTVEEREAADAAARQQEEAAAAKKAPKGKGKVPAKAKSSSGTADDEEGLVADGDEMVNPTSTCCTIA